MFISFLIMIIAGIVYVSVMELSTRFDFLISWIPYSKYLLIVACAVFIILVLITIIKAIKK